MKRVLMCKSSMGDSLNAIFQCVFTSLLKEECEVKVFTSHGFENESPQLLFDIIIVFNKESLISVTDVFQWKSVPIIYLFDDIDKNLAWNHPGVVKNIVIGESMFQLPPFIAQNEDYYLMYPIFDIKSVRQNGVSNFNLEELRLLFCVNDKVLLFLVPEINKIIHYKTTIICDNINLFRGLFNTSVRVLESCNISLSEQILGTDIFIGEKSKAALSISMCKSTIIVGQEGYGGMISAINIVQQAQNGFKGRIGGCSNEYIPIDLLFKDIDNCARYKQYPTYCDTLLYLSNQLNHYNEDNINMITDYIASGLLINMLKLEEKLLILDDNYFITSISDNKYLITDANIYKHVGILSDEEYCFIKQFRNPQTLKHVLNQHNTLSVAEAEGLLNELLNDRVIKIVNK